MSFSYHKEEVSRISYLVNPYAAGRYIYGVIESLEQDQAKELLAIHHTAVHKEKEKGNTTNTLPEGFYAIPTENVYSLNKKINKLNNRAHKLDIPPVEIEEIFSYNVKDSDTGRITRYTVFKANTDHDITIDGWELVARIDKEEGGPIISVIPGKEVNKDFLIRSRANPRACDHCHYNRARRKTFILFNKESGDWFQVGSNCLSDFIGEASAKKILSFNTLVKKLTSYLKEDYAEGDSYSSYFSVEDVIDVATTVISFYGYISNSRSSQTGEMPTSARVSQFMYNPAKLEETKLAEELKEGIVLDFASKDAISWAASLSDKEVEDNGYLNNLRSIARSTVVNNRQFGYTCSLPGAYARHMDIVRKKNKYNDKEIKTPMAEVGQKFSISMKPTATDKKQSIELLPATTITIISIKYNEDWGNWNIRFEDPCGKTGYTTTSIARSTAGEDLKERSQYLFEGRVKKVGSGKYSPYTTFNYCRFTNL